jgi:hypothetical protein
MRSDVSVDARIYGDADSLVAVRDLSLRNLTEGFQVFGKICGELQGDTTGTFLVVSFSANSSSHPHGSFEGKICMTTLCNREYLIPLYGSLVPHQP